MILELLQSHFLLASNHLSTASNSPQCTTLLKKEDSTAQNASQDMFLTLKMKNARNVMKSLIIAITNARLKKDVLSVKLDSNLEKMESATKRLTHAKPMTGMMTMDFTAVNVKKDFSLVLIKQNLVKLFQVPSVLIAMTKHGEFNTVSLAQTLL